MITPPPLWLMRQAGRYLPEYRALRAEVGGFLELCYDPVRASRVTLQPVERFGFDAAILFSDILVVPDALGVEVRFVEGEGPKLRPVSEAAAIARLDPGQVRRHLAPVYETVSRVGEALSERTALIGFAGAPWTVAVYVVEGGASKEFQKARLLARREPSTFAALIEILIEATVEHLSAQIEAGAEVVQLFDSWAGVLPESEFERWCIAPARTIREQLEARHPGIPVIGFPRGAGALYPRYLEATRVRALGLDTTVPLGWAREVMAEVPLQGNLDPMALLGPRSDLDQAIDQVRKGLKGTPHVFNLGHGVVPETDPDAVAALVRRVRGAG